MKMKTNSVPDIRLKWVCSSSDRRAMIGEPSSPPAYSPGPVNPSMNSTRLFQLEITGSQPPRYFRKMRCLAMVWGSASQIVSFGGMAHRLSDLEGRGVQRGGDGGHPGRMHGPPCSGTSSRCQPACSLALVKQPQAAIIESRFAAYFANWNLRLPRNAAALEEPGTVADDGWVVRYVFGSHRGEPYLEFYATHRMTDDRRVCIWGSGMTRSLETLRTMFAYRPEIPGDQERAARENRDLNVRITGELDELGLYPVGNVNAYLATHGVPVSTRAVLVEGEGPDEHVVSFADPDELMDEIDGFLAKLE